VFFGFDADTARALDLCRVIDWAISRETAGFRLLRHPAALGIPGVFPTYAW
jgi:hypothetical protein